MRDRDWLIPATVLVSIEILVAVVLSVWTGYPGRPLFLRQMVIASIVGGLSLVCVGLFSIFRLMIAGADGILPQLGDRMLKARSRLFTGFFGLQVIAVHIVAFGWIKSMLPWVVPFWADPMFAKLDLLLLAEPAWAWALGIFSPVSGFIRWTYTLWLVFHLAVLLGLLYQPPSRLKARLILTYFVTWMIGMSGAYAFSSAGPLFYQQLGFGDDFVALASQPHLGHVPQFADYLWANYTQAGVKIGSGISAMPSIHVAGAAWMAFCIWKLWPPFKWVGVAFFAAIFVGSFLLGWHYMVDAPAGVLCAWLGWLAAGQLTAKRSFDRAPDDRQPAQLARNPAPVSHIHPRR